MCPMLPPVPIPVLHGPRGLPTGSRRSSARIPAVPQRLPRHSAYPSTRKRHKLGFPGLSAGTAPAREAPLPAPMADRCHLGHLGHLGPNADLQRSTKHAINSFYFPYSNYSAQPLPLLQCQVNQMITSFSRLYQGRHPLRVAFMSEIQHVILTTIITATSRLF